MNESATWYESLVRPAFAPPPWVFGPVWTVLYVIIAITFGYVAWMVVKKRLPAATLVPFGLNLAFNLAFTPIQFGLKNNVLAAVDIVLVLATLLWAMASVWNRVRWVALANIPYLLWVSFATVLQFAITWLNR
jgi:benzodiazapine receptor